MSYSYSSYSSGGYGGDAFSQADLNQDGVVDRGEFQNFVGGTTLGAAGLGGASWGAGGGWSGGYDASYGVGGLVGGGSVYDSSYSAGGFGGLAGGVSSYDTSYSAGGFGGLAGGVSSYDTSYSSGVYGGDALAVGGAYGVGGATSVNYASSGGVYQDPNPQIIRRPAPGGAATYTQNIRVRFLQPPPVPPPGPIIIREVRPPQPPPLPPLRVTQRAPSLPQPPPLILRERPPVPPPVLPGRTIIRPLPAIPVPPRSLIIERLPPLPPRPRDVFIERWLQYGPQAKQRTIVQRAGAAHHYAAPRNVIIQYDAAPARVVRNFQRLGVTVYSPAQYVQQYGASLLDAGTLISQARAAGVVEDLTPPGVVGAVGFGASTYGQSASFGYDSGYAAGGLVGGAWGGDVVSGGWSGSVGGGWGGDVVSGGWGSDVISGGWGGDVVSGGWGGSVGGGWSGSVGGGWSGGLVGGGGLLGNVADAAFTAGDLNHSGGLDRAEFNNLVTGGGADSYLPTPW